ncbi:MAG: alpha/beta fold hydrolase [Gammaproteobacteria bacterium]|nr:alpha/beta fold hydrolase [Gammaproteobacteria bacterium]
MKAIQAALTLLALLSFVPTHAIDMSECVLKGAGGYGTVNAECGVWVRPENPDDPLGPTIELAVARIPALAPQPLPDAFTVINGGPGGSSIEMYADLARAFQPILRERDVLILDQRGTGQSNPLRCPDLEESIDTYSEAAVRLATKTCLERLTGDPRYYSTSVAVRDLEALRIELGYEQLNVYGVSYGTRVALHYLRRYPGSVRTLIIDGILPPGIILGGNVSENAQVVLDSIFARCAVQTQCTEQFPNLEANFVDLSQTLKTEPIPVRVLHPITGEAFEFDLLYQHMALAIRLLSYSTETASLIPLIINQAAEHGNYLPIATHAVRIITRLTEAISYGMHNAVVCTEDAPFYDLDAIDWTALQQTYLGDEQLKTLATMCDLWPEGVRDDDMHEPVHSDQPVLVLSGEWDPITPPQYGDLVSATLPNSIHLVIPGQGHGVISRGCVPRIVAKFIDEGTTATVEAGCIDRLGASPFFVDLMGPPP